MQQGRGRWGRHADSKFLDALIMKIAVGDSKICDNAAVLERLKHFVGGGELRRKVFDTFLLNSGVCVNVPRHDRTHTIQRGIRPQYTLRVRIWEGENTNFDGDDTAHLPS